MYYYLSGSMKKPMESILGASVGLDDRTAWEPLRIKGTRRTCFQGTAPSSGFSTLRVQAGWCGGSQRHGPATGRQFSHLVQGSSWLSQARAFRINSEFQPHTDRWGFSPTPRTAQPGYAEAVCAECRHVSEPHRAEGPARFNSGCMGSRPAGTPGLKHHHV